MKVESENNAVKDGYNDNKKKNNMARKENYNIDKVIADYDRIIKELEEKGEQLRVKKAVSELEKIKPSESLEKKNKIKL